MLRSTLIILSLALLLQGCGAPDKPTVSLYLAVQRGDIEQVERHIYWGTDLNSAFPNGRYPIHDAADIGRIILLKELIGNGAQLDVVDSAGRTAIDLAILSGRTQAAEVLVAAGAGYDASQLLLLAAQNDATDRDIVRFLATHGANLEATDEQGNTPLIIATSRGNHRLVHHLVEQGAPINTRNTEGRSALDVASDIGATEIESFLLRNGAVRKR